MHNNSPRRRQSGLRRLSSLAKGHRILAVTAASCALALLGGGIATASTLAFGDQQFGTQYSCGEQIASDQRIQPIGDRLMTPFGKLMGSVVSRKGRYLVGTSADRSVDLQVFDLSTYKPVSAAGTIKQTFAVGIAPRQLKFVGNTLYVSNEGGRLPVAGDTTMGSYGTQVPADTTLGTSTTGTVSVIDTANPSTPVSSIPVQLHPTAMYLDGTTLYVANTNSDTVSVIDTKTGTVMQTIATQPWASSKTGYEPTAITMQGDHLLVSLGRANAIAVYKVDTKDPRDPASYIGLLPTDYFPENVSTVNGQIVVTNTRGIDARGPALTYNKGQGTTPATGHGTHSTTASLTRFTLSLIHISEPT